MKALKILFVDFWPGWNPESNPLIDILRKHFVVELTHEPDFVIYSNFGYRHLAYDAPRMFYTGENLRPDFNICDYALGYDRMTFGDRYFRFTNYMMDCHKELCEVGERKYVPGPRKFCNFVYSNPHADPTRDVFFRMLSAYKPVDSAGRHLNNTGFRIVDKASLQKGYKFSIAFENSSSPGYTSEKIVQAYAAGTVPIYWGASDVALDFNRESFVNCHDYPSFEKAIERVMELDNDELAFARMYEAPFFCRPLIGYAFEPGFEEFLVHVFGQAREKAFRRNRQFWGRAYETQRRKLASYISRLDRNPLFSLKEHVRMLGTQGTAKKIGEKVTEKRQENKEARLPDA
ncbi:MAG: glycosyltransferase family 10 [Spirochaetia bacterium]